MTVYRYKRVLLADDNARRAHIIERTLRRYWKAPTQIVGSMDEVSEVSTQTDASGSRFDVIMVVFGFDGLKHLDVFQQLAKSRQKRVLLDNVPDRPLPSSVESLLVVPDDAVVGDPRLLQGLAPVMGSRPPELPALSNGGSLSNTLRLQIRWLDPQGDLEKGKDTLRELLCQSLPDVQAFMLHSIGQGFSGASVFRISCTGGAGTSDFVLKLTPKKDEWKCEHEVKCSHEIAKYFRGDIVPLVPQVHTSYVSHGTGTPPAQSPEWTAAVYTFLGGDTLVCDLERAFVDPNGCLSDLVSTGSSPPPDVNQMNLNLFFVDKLFQGLVKLYRRGACIGREVLWSVAEPHKQGPLSFPPYCFTAWERCKIIKAIHQLDAYGYSMRRARWRKNRRLLLACVPTKGKPSEKLVPLLNKRPVLLAHVHGDLNANNALMALEFGLPFVIDLACFQSKGHMIQDFARLEVAIKIELMGREKEMAPEGLDLNARMFGKWCGAEDWLCRWPRDDAGLGSAVDDEPSVIRAYSMCRHVRSLGRAIHADLLSHLHRKASFEVSYNAALLYHTIRAIRYDSLPHLKRILAAYCAGRTLEQLQY